MLFEELWYQYYLAYEKIDTVLNKHPGLNEFLWNIAKEGVSNNDFEAVVNKFPPEFSKLVDASYMYHSNPITTVKALKEFEKRFVN